MILTIVSGDCTNSFPWFCCNCNSSLAYHYIGIVSDGAVASQLSSSRGSSQYHNKTRFRKPYITGWWFQPIWKILVKMGSSSPGRGENKTCLSCHHLDNQFISETENSSFVFPRFRWFKKRAFSFLTLESSFCESSLDIKGRISHVSWNFVAKRHLATFTHISHVS